MSTPAPGSPEHRRLVTASKAAAILGLSPWQSPYSLWQLMKGNVEPEPQTKAQSRGHYLEPAILAWFRDRHALEAGEFFREQVWHLHEDWAGATVDAEFMATDGLVIVEAKSAARMDDWGTPGTDQVPDYYLAQIFFQLAVTGAARCFVPVIGPYLEFSEYVVEADPVMQGQTLAACRRFYDSLASDVPPELDDHVATFATVKALHPDIDKGDVHDLDPDLAVEYVTASLDLKAAEQRDREARTRVLDAMGRAQYADALGTRIARRQAAKHGISLVRAAKTIPTRKEEVA